MWLPRHNVAYPFVIPAGSHAFKLLNIEEL